MDDRREIVSNRKAGSKEEKKGQRQFPTLKLQGEAQLR